MEVTDVRDNAANDVREGHYYENSVGLYQTYDRLNDRQLPTSGYLFRLNETLYGTPLPGSSQYAEVSASADTYSPLYELEDGGVTFLRLSGRCKAVDALADTSTVPFYARIRGGGQSPRHRGFDDYELGPKQVNNRGQEANVGGTKDLLLTAEMSFPVMGSNEGIRLVGFTDYGNVWGDNENPKFSDMRTAVGFGIRFPIQLPVSLDFAWLVDRQPGESASQIHFGLGISRF
jgi:outer membrane protein insertion porin family